MLFDQRVLYSDNGTITDISVELNNFRSKSVSLPIVASEDFLFIGSWLPFNHKHFDIEVANSNPTSLGIKVWDGDDFKDVVETHDLTMSSGATLSESGIVRFTPDRDESWAREPDSFDVTGLENTEIYDLYWLRIQFSADLDAGTRLKFIGQKFSTDDELYDLYPDLNQTALLTAYDSSKTSWDEQHFIAAETIGRDLRKKSAIITSDQIIDYETFNEPSIHKVAEIVYHGLGRSYWDVRDEARKKYLETVEQGFLRLDLNFDGRLSGAERGVKQGRLKR